MEGPGAENRLANQHQTFRTKRDAEDWARRTENEVVRGVYIQRSGSERMTPAMALKRCLSEISPTKKPTTQKAGAAKALQLIHHLGKYSVAALSAEIIANYRDTRLYHQSRQAYEQQHRVTGAGFTQPPVHRSDSGVGPRTQLQPGTEHP